MKRTIPFLKTDNPMRKILIAAGAMICLAGAAVAAASEPIFEPIPMVDVSADFDVLAALPDISADVDLMAVDGPAPVVAIIQPSATHGVVPVLILSAQADVMPDFALSGGDGRPI